MKTKLTAILLGLTVLVLALASCGVTATPTSTTAAATVPATEPATDPVTDPATEPATTVAGETELFVYELDPDDGAFYALIGLSDAGKAEAELTVPATYNDLPVTMIAADAFNGSTASKITLCKSVVTIADGAFNGSAATSIIFSDMEEIVLISVLEDGIGAMFTAGVLAGANENVKVYVPADVYETYLADYFWGDYSSILESLN